MATPKSAANSNLIPVGKSSESNNNYWTIYNELKSYMYSHAPERITLEIFAPLYVCLGLCACTDRTERFHVCWEAESQTRTRPHTVISGLLRLEYTIKCITNIIYTEVWTEIYCSIYQTLFSRPHVKKKKRSGYARLTRNMNCSSMATNCLSWLVWHNKPVGFEGALMGAHSVPTSWLCQTCVLTWPDQK